MTDKTNLEKKVQRLGGYSSRIRDIVTELRDTYNMDTSDYNEIHNKLLLFSIKMNKEARAKGEKGCTCGAVNLDNVKGV